MAGILFERLQKLRTQIEASIPAPAVILVTSATGNDGASVAAASIAGSLSLAGHRVVLLHDSIESDAQRVQQQSPFPRIVLTNELAAQRNAGDAVNAVAEKVRRDYDYAIVDRAPILENSVSLRFASIADAVLLTVRVGRLACAQDEATVDVLRLAQARVLGVIAVAEANIEKKGDSADAVAARGDAAERSTSGPTTVPLGAVR